MIGYLVINNPRNRLIPFREQYKVFADRGRALEWAVACGMTDQFGMGVSTTVGVMTQYMCGDVNVSFMPIEVVSNPRRTRKKTGHWRKDNVAV